MRFFEFSRTQPGNITIPQILDIVKDPSADPALKKDITNALQVLVSKKPKVKDQEVPQVNEQEASTDIVSTIENDEQYYQQLLNSDPRLKAYLEKKIAQASSPDVVIQNLDTEINKILSTIKEIPEDVREAVAQQVFTVVRKLRNTDVVLKFLQDCASGNKPIDLPGIVDRGGSGQLLEPGHPYFEIIRYLAKINPGTGNSASGQGEWMLVLAAADTRKITPGDIEIGNLRTEVKASDSKGTRSKLTDFVLSSSKLPVKQARSHLANSVNTLLGRKEIHTGRASEGGISQLNNKTINWLNPLLIEINNKNPGAVQKIFKEMWTMVFEDPQLEKYIDNVIKAINKDGSLDLENLYGPTATLAAASYKLSNKHDILLLLSVPSLEYTVVNDPTEMSNLFKAESQLLAMTSIFDFRENPGSPTFTRLDTQTTVKSKKRKQTA